MSYCLETDAGGVHVRNSMIRLRDRTSFLMEDRSKPGVILDFTGNILDMNDPFRYKLSRFLQHNIKDVLSATSLQLWDTFVYRAKASSTILSETIPVNFAQQRVTSNMHLLTIQEQQQVIASFETAAENSTVPQKAYLKAFYQASSFQLFVDDQGIICDVNDMSELFFNKSRQYFLNKPIQVLTNLLKNTSKNHIPIPIEQRIGTNYEQIILFDDEATNDVKYYHLTSFYDKELEMSIIEIVDQTAEKKLEQRLAHFDSLSSIGQVAASIAHEIRNPMTTLKGFLQLVGASATGDTVKYLEVINSELDRMDSILNEMLILSKPTDEQIVDFSLSTLVDEVLKIIYPKALMDGLKVTREDSQNMRSTVVGNPDKMKQVLLNLFKNALESMVSGGSLYVSLQNDESNNCKLLVQDTGIGMSAQQLNAIFLPFFTSKKTGTGLGLPFVLKTVEEMGGSLDVASELGVGTTITLTFPEYQVEPMTPMQNHIATS